MCATLTQTVTTFQGHTLASASLAILEMERIAQVMFDEKSEYNVVLKLIIHVVFFHVSVACLDIDECQLSSPCQSLATCSNTEGSFSCKCREGYHGDGTINCTGNLNKEKLKPYIGSVYQFNTMFVGKYEIGKYYMKCLKACVCVCV